MFYYEHILFKACFFMGKYWGNFTKKLGKFLAKREIFGEILSKLSGNTEFTLYNLLKFLHVSW